MDLHPLRKPSKLKIYAPWFAPTNWIYKYRIEHPLRALDETGLSDTILDRRHVEKLLPGFDDAREARIAAMSLADAYWLHMDITEQWLDIARKEVRPAIFYGVDDHVEEIDYLNPAFKTLGTKVDGKLLEEGAVVRMRKGPGNKDRILYEDGKPVDMDGTIFDVKENHARVKRLKSFAVLADGIVVSTPYLENVWRAYGAGNILVYPNSINFGIYPEIELRDHPKEVRILWTGGASHFTDLFDIVAPLKRVLKKYPHATFHVFGQEWQWLAKELGGAQCFYDGWVDPQAYTLRLSTLNHDINLCPLRETPFNEAKSAIKWYESSAICKPAATLAKRFGAFLEIEEDKTGLLYTTNEEFELKLSALIEDASLRQRLAKASSEWVHEFRDLRKNVLPLGLWIQERCEVRRNANASAASEPDEPRVE